MAVAISVKFVVTIHTTRFDIRTVHWIIIFFWEVTQFDMCQQLERASCLSLRSTLKMAAAYFFERLRSQAFGEADILHRPCWVFDHDTSGTQPTVLSLWQVVPHSRHLDAGTCVRITVILVAASNITRSDKSYDTALR